MNDNVKNISGIKFEGRVLIRKSIILTQLCIVNQVKKFVLKSNVFKRI